MIKTFIKNFKFSLYEKSREAGQISNSREGQSLIEILISLAVGSILIGAAAIGIAFMLRSTATNQRLQIASGLARDLVEKTRSWSASDWQNVYALQKGTSTKYFLVPSSTAFSVILGEEGMLENEVRVGLVGKWGFDEATGTIVYDVSGNGNNGVLTNNPVRIASTSCWVGNCLNFFSSNTAKVALSITTSTNLSNPFTLSAWIKRTESISSQARVVGRGDDYLMFLANDNKLHCYAGGLSPADFSSSVTILQNKWTHIACVFGASINSVFVDGTINFSAAFSGTISGSVPEITIGNYFIPSASYFFPGSIDDVRIYNRALTATEIKNLYQSKTFSRYFNIQNTCRQPGATDILVGSTCSPPYVEDPSTQQISVFVHWPGITNLAELKLVEYITRWRNEILHEENWSGGSGQEGPIIAPNGRFASSTNINIGSYGVIKVRPQ